MSQVTNYLRPLSVQAACEALQANPNAKLVAGGQSLLPTMRLGLALFDEIIDLQGLSGPQGAAAEPAANGAQSATFLNHIKRDIQAHTLTIGAMASHAQIHASAAVQAFCPMLKQLAGGIGDQQVRNMGTIGGSIANHDPAACWPAGLLACGGVVNIASVTQTRQVAIDDFFTSLFSTDSVTLNKPLTATYIKFEQPASRFALVGVAMAQHAHHFRVAITGLGHGAMRWHEAEGALAQAMQNPDPATLAQALQPLHLDPEFASGDMHASAAYRVHIAKVLCERAVQQLF
jgi:carbon-monoxide dehydrogenase medium subunit